KSFPDVLQSLKDEGIPVIQSMPHVGIIRVKVDDPKRLDHLRKEGVLFEEGRRDIRPAQSAAPGSASPPPAASPPVWKAPDSPSPALSRSAWNAPGSESPPPAASPPVWNAPDSPSPAPSGSAWNAPGSESPPPPASRSGSKSPLSDL